MKLVNIFIQFDITYFVPCPSVHHASLTLKCVQQPMKMGVGWNISAQIAHRHMITQVLLAIDLLVEIMYWNHLYQISGLCYKNIGRLEDSLDCFFKLHAILRSHPQVMFQLADVYPFNIWSIVVWLLTLGTFKCILSDIILISMNHEEKNIRMLTTCVATPKQSLNNNDIV